MEINGQSTMLDQTPWAWLPDVGTGPAGGGVSPPVGGAGGVVLSGGFAVGSAVVAGIDGAVDGGPLEATGRLSGMAEDGAEDGAGVVAGEEPPPPPQAASPTIRAREQRLEEAVGFMNPGTICKRWLPHTKSGSGTLPAATPMR